jgi:hypothetical protein
MLQASRIALQYFFSTLFATVDEGYVEIRPFTANGKLAHRRRVFLKANDSTALAQHVISLRRSLHVFFGVCTRTDEGKRVRRGTLAHVGTLTALWADIDVKTFGGLAKARNAVDRFALKPSILVFTGHGYHAYWLLEDAVSLNTPARDSAQAMLKALQVSVLGSDDVSDLARVMRSPWSYNLKDSDYPPLVQVLSLREIRYSFDALREFLPWREALSKPEDSSACGSLVEGRYYGIDKVMKSDFIKHCREHAKTLSEPLWYAMITNLIGFRGGRDVIHKLSQPHFDYSYDGTEQKIEHALRDAPGPHSYQFISSHGYQSSGLSDPSLQSPAACAFRRRSNVGNLTGFDNSGGEQR